jgi:hypothetical protein
MMSQKTTNSDTTIDEIHQTRQQIAKKFDGNIAAILEDARKRQEASNRPIWRGSSSNGASDSGQSNEGGRSNHCQARST